MKHGAVDRMSYSRLIRLPVDGMMRGWKDAVVHRAGFSDEPNSFPLGLWDKSDNLAHIRLLPYRAAHWQRLVWGDGARCLRQQAEESEGIFPNPGKHRPSPAAPAKGRASRRSS